MRNVPSRVFYTPFNKFASFPSSDEANKSNSIESSLPSIFNKIKEKAKA